MNNARGEQRQWWFGFDDRITGKFRGYDGALAQGMDTHPMPLQQGGGGGGGGAAAEAM